MTNVWNGMVIFSTTIIWTLLLVSIALVTLLFKMGKNAVTAA